MNNIQTAKLTQIEMLVNRGYTIPEEEQNLKKIKKLTLNQTYTKDNNILYVYYLNEETLAADLKIFVQVMKNKTHGIIIGNLKSINKLSSKTYYDQFQKLKLKTIQLFNEDELQYNISTNHLNGTFKKIAKSLIIPSLCHADELPKLLINDPIVRYYGFEAGDVIEMVEDNEVDMLTTKNISYAIVVNEYITEM